MGGKKQQAQRTKGNVRPSSSGRSAELLGVSTAFQTFTSPFQDTLAGDDPEVATQPDFKVAMKKMTKKDLTTKMKAVEEFIELCKERSSEEVLSVLPSWPRLYTKLSCEYDNRLRENAQKAMEQVAVSVKRELAPYLKQIMGPWTLSMCDPYPPIAQRAKQAFKAAFPPNKQVEAIMFCKDEIFSCIEDNLFIQTPQTLSDPKMTPQEEMEQKYERMVASCLGATSFILNNVSADQINKLEPNLHRLLQEAKFWKYAKSKVPQIAASWLLLICGLCTKTPWLMTPHAKKVCPAIVQRLDDPDPLVISFVWEAVLSVIVKIEDCWDHLPVEKVIMPKLFNLLKKGGGGNASVIYPNLLPFLSKLPSSKVPDVCFFYNSFFSNMAGGLRAQSSPSDMSAILRSYFECVRYVISSPSLQPFHESCLKDHLSVLILVPVLERESKLRSSILYHLFSDLNAYICRQMQESDEGRAQAFAVLYRTLWEQLMPTFLHIVSVADLSLNYALNSIELLFCCLRNPDKNMLWPKNETKVRFLEIPVVSPVNKGVQFNVYTDSLEAAEHAIRVAAATVDKVSTSPLLLKFFASLMKHYYCNKFFEGVTGSGGSPVRFFDVILLPSMQTNKDSIIPLVEMTLATLYCCQDEEEGGYVLNEVTKVDNLMLLQEVIQACIRHLPSNPAVITWLKSESLRQVIVESVKSLKEESEGLLSLALTLKDDLEPLFGRELVETIMRLIVESIGEQRPIASRCSVLSYACTLSHSCFSSPNIWQIPASEELLFSLVSVSMSPSLPPVGILEKVEQCWGEGLLHLLRYKGGFLKQDGFFQKVAETIKDRLLDGTLRSEARLKAIIKICQSLLDIMEECVCSSYETRFLDDESCCQFLWLLLPSENVWETMEEMQHPLLIQDLLFRKNLYLPSCVYANQEWQSLGEGEMELSVATTATLVLSLLQHVRKSGGERTNFSRFSFQIDHILFASEYVKSMVNVYREESQGNLVELLRALENLLVKETSVFVTSLTKVEQKELTQRVLERSSYSGGIWSCSLASLLATIGEEYNMTVPIPNDMPVSTAELHNFQLLYSYQSSMDQDRIVDTVLSIMLSMPGLPQGRAMEALVCLTRCVKRSKPAVVPAILDYLSSCEGLLTATSLSSYEWSPVCRAVWVMKLLEEVMQSPPPSLQTKHWDWMLCNLCSWIETVFECEPVGGKNLSELCFIQETCRLMSVTANLMQHLLNNPEETSKYPPTLLEEWTECFADNLFKVIIPVYVKLSDRLKNVPLNPASRQLLGCVCSAASLCPRVQLLENQLAAQSSADDEKVEPGLATLLNTLASLLTHPQYIVQTTAYTLLSTVIGLIPPKQKNDSCVDDEMTPLPHPLRTLVEETQEVLASELTLGRIREGESCLVLPHTDVFPYTTAHLFTWRLVMEYLSGLKKENSYLYINYITEDSSFNRFLSNLFKIIPEKFETFVATSELPSSITDINTTYEGSSEEVMRLALGCYWVALCRFPALVRQWWHGLDKRAAIIVERCTSQYLTPLLCQQDYSSANGCSEMDNVKFTARPSMKQIVATYYIEELTTELLVNFPDNYPLAIPTVETSKRIGVSKEVWRKWMLRFNVYLKDQNGSIIDGMLTWKKNIDKKFQGTEECNICFCVVHISSFQLPTLSCRVCRKKFHSDCLARWFRTSRNKTCPICRTSDPTP